MAFAAPPSDQVLAAIVALPLRKELTVRSRRAEEVRCCAEKVAEHCMLEHNGEKFAEFSAKLLLALNSILEGPKYRSCPSKQRKRMWEQYSILRSEKLPAIWKQFLVELRCSDISDPLFIELTNESLLEELIHKNSSTPPQRTRPPAEPTKDEENVIRYASGYVGMKLHRHFSKRKDDKAAQFIEVIDHMYVDGPTTSLLDYTREWVRKVNRGGLFDVSDEAYLLFYWIEEAMIEQLTSHMKRSVLLTPTESEEAKQVIIDSVVFDADVQYRWFVIASDIADDESSNELLSKIVSLWLTIRGFAISKSWMEDYKVKEATTVKAKKSLRKELQKASNTTTLNNN